MPSLRSCRAAKVHLNMDRTVGGAGRSHLAVLETGPALPRLRRRRGQAGATCFRRNWPYPISWMSPFGASLGFGVGHATIPVGLASSCLAQWLGAQPRLVQPRAVIG